MWDTNDWFSERERWASTTQENSARSALAWGRTHTRGWGELIIDEPIMFGATFTEEPTVTYGFALDDDDEVVNGRLPRCSGGVLRWVKTAGGYYIGAHCFVTVFTVDPIEAIQAWLDESLSIGATRPPEIYKVDPAYNITHSFTFRALAIKEIGG